jgi:hypothetical protein
MRLLALSLIVALLIPVRIAGERLAAGAVATAFARIPRHFEPNQGQTPQREILFLSAGDSHLLGITADGILLMDRQGRTAQLTFIGARVPVEVSGTDPLPSVTNYLYGQDSSTWRTAVPHFQRVKLANVYAGIDVVFYVSGRDIEYDFEIAAGVDPQQIRMSWDSARKLQLEANGDLTAQTAAGPVTLARPKAWQPSGIHRREVEVRFAIDAGSGQFGFVTGPYDSSLPLTIDPTLSYAGFIGGSQYDEARSIAVDAQGNAYYCGTTRSSNLPSTESFQAAFAGGNGDAFIAKVNSAGTSLLYLTYLGGSGWDQANSIAVDADGNAYVAGLRIPPTSR